MKILAGLLVCSTLLFSQTQKLIIDAQNFEADDKKGISSFDGDVKIEMGKDKLAANSVDIYFETNKNTGKKTPLKYIATGKVKFEIVNEQKHYKGKGNKVIYFPSKQEYTVIGNGFIEELNDNRKIYGDKIYVNQVSGEAKVQGSEKKPVRFIIDIEQGEGK